MIFVIEYMLEYPGIDIGGPYTFGGTGNLRPFAAGLHVKYC